MPSAGVGPGRTPAVCAARATSQVIFLKTEFPCVFQNDAQAEADGHTACSCRYEIALCVGRPAMYLIGQFNDGNDGAAAVILDRGFVPLAENLMRMLAACERSILHSSRKIGPFETRVSP